MDKTHKPTKASLDFEEILHGEMSAEDRHRLDRLAPDVIAKLDRHPLINAIRKRLLAEGKTARTVETYLAVLRQGLVHNDLLHPLRSATSDARYNVVHSALRFVDSRIRAWKHVAEQKGMAIDIDEELGITVTGILDRAADIPPPHKHNDPVIPPTVDEWKSVVAAAKTFPSPIREVLLIILRTGLRVTDVLMISRDRLLDIHAGQTITLQKGKKPRVWKMHPLVEANLQKLLKDPDWQTIEDLVYRLYAKNLKGLPAANDRRMAVYHYLRRSLDKACRKAHIRIFSPHKFRHALASYLHDAGLNMRGVQQALGHSDMDTTQGYIHDIEDGDMEQAQAKVMAKIEEDA